MSKDSPHSDMLLKSFASMLKNKDNMKLFDKKLGKYPCGHLVKMQMILNLQSLVR